MTHTDAHELDLPLLSNNDEINIHHYFLDLCCHFNEKCFQGTITVFCKPVDFEKTANTKCDSEASKTDLPPLDCQKDSSEKASGSERINTSHLNLVNEDKLINSTKDSNKLTESKPTNNVGELLSENDIRLKSTQLHNLPAVWTSEGTQNVNFFSNATPKPEEENIVITKYDRSSGAIKWFPKEDAHEMLDKTEKESDENKYDIPVRENSVKRFENDSACSDSCKEDSLVYEQNSEYCKEFKMTLDCWDIDVYGVEEIECANQFDDNDKSGKTSEETYKKYIACSECEGMRLEFQSDKRYVKLWKEGVKTAKEFPRVVRISFRTHPKGHSLKWTKDQDGRECVFTHGHWINNRSLFPSQDVPVAMATWQAVIRVPEETVVLMSGDEEPTVTSYKTGWLSYSFFSRLQMPSSTISLAIGYWKSVNIVLDRRRQTACYQEVPISDDHLLPCRLFSPSCHIDQAMTLIGGYMPRCMEAASQMLGPHPFKRLDILVVPSSFCSLGMASPSLMFVSQSLLSADQEMCIRLAHELSHSWFGLIIGPRDWTEEWLSEGFCTYTEDYLHGIAMQWTDREKEEQTEIRDYLKYKNLEAESLSTDTELLTLRPSKGETDYKDGETKYVKNGMNPEKGFLQVHYLKGYFLLQYLESNVGRENFHQFLRLFVQKFSGKLVLSRDFLSLYFETFHFLRDRGITEENIYTDWLDKPGLPMCKSLTLSKNNWAKGAMNQLKPVQVLLVLDYLLLQEKIHTDVLHCLRDVYKLERTNADIRHKWCELVVKNRSQQHYIDVKSFLINHQAMGVYLFGELILSGDKEQRKLAESCFRHIADGMEDGVYRTVHLMVYGTEAVNI